MLIRKLFKYEMGHIVRNAWSQRCAKSFHGHSYVAEFYFKSDHLDNGGMVSDFGYLKKYIHPFVDSFDHASVLWNRPEDAHIVKFFLQEFDRVVVTDFTSAVEMQAAMFYCFGVKALKQIPFINGERNVKMHSVRVHETTTGWAEYGVNTPQIEGIEQQVDISKIYFSDGIKAEWPDHFAKFWKDLVRADEKHQPSLPTTT